MSNGITVTGPIEFLLKDGPSNVGNCPSVLRVDEGYLVVGKRVDAATRARAAEAGAGHDSGIADDEDVVFVPANVLDRLPAAV